MPHTAASIATEHSYRPRTGLTDGYQTSATCHTLIIDVLDGSPPTAGERTIKYTLANGN